MGNPSFLDASVVALLFPGNKLDDGLFTMPCLGKNSSISLIESNSSGIGCSKSKQTKAMEKSKLHVTYTAIDLDFFFLANDLHTYQ